MSLAVRVIPCLDVDGGRVVKGVNFIDLRDAGDPVEMATVYDAEGADELTFLDITASSSGRETTYDVVGRTAGTVPDFNYSKVLKGSGVVWTEETLDKWLANPQAFIPGQRMNFKVVDPADRADLIAYLKSLAQP